MTSNVKSTAQGMRYACSYIAFSQPSRRLLNNFWNWDEDTFSQMSRKFSLLYFGVYQTYVAKCVSVIRRQNCLAFQKWAQMDLPRVSNTQHPPQQQVSFNRRIGDLCSPANKGHTRVIHIRYSKEIISVIASQIAGGSIVDSINCSGADQRKHLTPRHWLF